MRVIVAGSRTITSIEEVTRAITASGYKVTEVVSGGAHGVDWCGEQWAKTNGKQMKRFPADWHTHGWRGGLVRNEEMARYADALVAVWDGQSRGTQHMIRMAQKYKLKIHVHEVR